MIKEEDLKKDKPDEPEKIEGTLTDFFFNEVLPHIIKNRDRLDNIDFQLGMMDLPPDKMGVIRKNYTGFDILTIKFKPR